MTVIGTDSALKRYLNVTTEKLSLASAERADVLVSFQDCGSDYSYAVVTFNDGRNVLYLRKFTLVQNSISNYQAITELDVPFVNLTN